MRRKAEGEQMAYEVLSYGVMEAPLIPEKYDTQ